MKYLIASLTLILSLQFLTAQVPCSVDNLQNGPANSGYLQWNTINSSSYVYMDISASGSPGDPGCSGDYPYLVESVEIKIADLYYFTFVEPPLPGNAVVSLGIAQMADPDDICEGPGAEIFMGPNINISVGDTLNYLSQTINEFVNGPFFIKYKLISFDGNTAQVPTPIWNNDPRPPCRQWHGSGTSVFTHELFFGNTNGWIDTQVFGQSSYPAPSKVQIIHNCADLAAQTVDIRVNGEFTDPTFDNLNFRFATPFIEIESDQTIIITVNAPNSIDDSNPLFTDTLDLSPGNNYVVVANGIISSSGYLPDNGAVPFNLMVNDEARITATISGNTDILPFHGITDGPIIDINKITPPIDIIANDLSYGSFSSYSGFTTNNFSVEISDNGTQVQDYSALLNTWNLDNQAITICASGFMNPSLNSNGPLFGLWAALAGGGPMLELPFISGLFDQATIPTLSIYPNPTSDFFVIRNQNKSGNRLEIVDSKGALKLSRFIKESNEIIETEQLSAGLYYVLLKDYKGNINGRNKLIITSK